MGSEPAGFREFVCARSPALLRTAWMLTGDGALAEDLLQTALARTSSSWRARRWTQEKPSSDTLSAASHGHHLDESARTDERVVLATALGSLPVGQRQAVVLRFFDDLSVEEVAHIMGCSTGTVKSQTAKGLAKLRAAMEATAVLERRER